MSPAATTVVVPTLGGERVERMLASLAAQTVEHQTVVVDNGSPGDRVARACAGLPGAELVRMPENVGYTRAINLGVERADGEIVVLLNDDCVVEPAFVERIGAPIDPAAGVVMAAGVMRDWRDRSLIDSAGMELDPTLLVFDYLNGEPLTRLAGEVGDPIGPSAAAAAFDRATFRAVGGFDERLFAYWEDVDLVLRLRRLGLSCALARDALGDHEHSATLGSGSARKNFLMGFGRGYVLRKWQVLDRRRLAAVLVRDGMLCAGQALFDRNLAGLRGRLRGYRAAAELERYPSELGLSRNGAGAADTLRRRARRRARLRSAATRSPAATRAGVSGLAFFHLSETTGPSRSLVTELRWLAERGNLEVVVPGPGTGRVGELLGDRARVMALDYEALTQPSADPLGFAREALRLRRDVRAFRGLIRRARPDLVISVTTRLPAVSIAAWLERRPLLVYCGELYERGQRGLRGDPLRTLAGGALAGLTARLADVVIACSDTVAEQFDRDPAAIETVYPPIGDYSAGDAGALRAGLPIAGAAPLIASIGYLTEGRGQDVLVRAMPAILERLPEARYLLVGRPFPRPQDRAYREALLELIARLGIEDRVIVAGHVEDVAGVYAAADLVVNPARFAEPFGRVPFEAAVAGLPSVVTRVGAIPELLRDGESALVVPPDDPAAIAGAVARLAGDPALGERLVAGARAVVADRLTPAHSLAGFQRAVARTVERPDRS